MEYCSMSIFVQGCLAMLENLKLHLTGLVQNNMPCMSVLQEQDILILLHFVVNVGLVRHFDFQVTLCAEQLENRPPCRYRDLKSSVCVLISLCDCEVLRGLIFPKHLLHVLGALLMLCYSPICR
uniref:Uncharacterized protein n=1 Tax=Ciona savignyi TaxID=51511 RepID=H2ZPR1_CIOSA